MLRPGGGIALGRSLLSQCDLDSGRLRRLFDVEVKADYSYWMVWSPVSPKLANIELFRAWVAEELADFTVNPCHAANDQSSQAA